MARIIVFAFLLAVPLAATAAPAETPQHPPAVNPAPVKPGPGHALSAKPDPAKPDPTKPDPTKPGLAKPGPARPGPVAPISSKPSSGKPISGESSSGRPTSVASNSGRPGSVKPSSASPNPAKPGLLRATAANASPAKPGSVKPGPAAQHPAPVPASAAAPLPKPSDEPAKGSNTGLPLPRFASLKTDEVNLRSGPGTRYPIEWVYKRHDLPVQIEREFEVWRLVADAEGTKGWVHQATLVGRRTFVVKEPERTLREDAKPDAPPVARLKPGVIGRIRSCEANADWCQVQVGDYRGWLSRDAFWGTYPKEAIQ